MFIFLVLRRVIIKIEGEKVKPRTLLIDLVFAPPQNFDITATIRHTIVQKYIWRKKSVFSVRVGLTRFRIENLKFCAKLDTLSCRISYVLFVNVLTLLPVGHTRIEHDKSDFYRNHVVIEIDGVFFFFLYLPSTQYTYFRLLLRRVHICFSAHYFGIAV